MEFIHYNSKLIAQSLCPAQEQDAGSYPLWRDFWACEWGIYCIKVEECKRS